MTKKLILAISDTEVHSLTLLLDKILKLQAEDFETKSFSNINNKEKLQGLLKEYVQEKTSPLIIYTFEDKGLSSLVQDFSDTYQFRSFSVLGPLENIINLYSKYSNQVSTELYETNSLQLNNNVDSINFAYQHDDGKDNQGILDADVVLIGISRTSKTPVSMYLAHHNLKVANVPLYPESRLPQELFEIPSTRVFGLTSRKEHLSQLRVERLKNLGLPTDSPYASIPRIEEEMTYANWIMKIIGCPIIDVSTKAVEEIADTIIRHLKNGSIPETVKGETKDDD